MIDLHSHVLPGVDDGAKDMDMCLEMLRESRKQGVEILAATPHCMPKNEEAVDEYLAKRDNAYRAVIEKIENKDEFPKLIFGAEVFLGTDISEYRNLKSLCYKDTDYILLEMVEDFNIHNITEWVYNIKIKGLKPVIAHVDRYDKCFEIMEELAPLNVVFQLNGARFLSMGGRKKLKNIFELHDKFLVSTDMHNTSTRPCNMTKASEVVKKKFSPLYNMLFEDMGRCIVENK